MSGVGQEGGNKQIAVNTLMLLVRILIITLINLYSVRIVLSNLGTIDYGIFNAVVGVVMTCSCLLPLFAMSVQRFYSYAMGQGDYERLTLIFSASLNIIVVLSALLLLLFETAGLWMVLSQLSYPAERAEAVAVIFQMAIATLLLTFIQIPFTAQVFAHEDMGVYTLVSSVDCLMKLAVAATIGLVAVDPLKWYTGGLTVVALTTFLVYALCCRRRYAECRYRQVREGKIYRELLSFSGWSFYGSLAGMAMVQGNSILLNLFWGPVANAAFGVATNIYNAFQAVSNSIVLAFRPRMIKCYATQAHQMLVHLFGIGNKALLYLLMIVAIPIVVEMEAILRLWLGEADDLMVVFSRLFVVYTVIMNMHNPITIIIQATGQIRNYYLFVESIIILSLPLAWVLFTLGLPAQSMFWAMISLCVVAHVVRLVSLARRFPPFRAADYVRQILCPAAVVCALAGGATCVLHRLLSSGVAGMIGVLVCGVAFCVVSVVCIGLSKAERGQLLALVQEKLRR